MLLATGLNAHPKIARELESLPPSAKVEVIVQYKDGSSGGLLGRLPLLGGVINSTLNLVNSLLMTLTGQQILNLAADPTVEYISPDRVIKGTMEYANPAIYANLARQAGYNGSGVTVAVIDSGVTAEPDLRGGLLNLSRVIYSESFVPGDRSTSDQYGHGTHVAGIVAGDGGQSSGALYTRTFLGIAPAARIVNLRVLDAEGKSSDSAVIAAISRAIELKPILGIRVINLSLGRPIFESYTKDPLCRAVEKAWKAGIVVVVAAGNEGRNNAFGTGGYGMIMSPANDPYVITVGAMRDMSTSNRSDDQIASYSSKGPSAIDHVVKPDIVAPGNQIISLSSQGRLSTLSSLAVNQIPWNYYSRLGNSSASTAYFKLSGTSMAAPMVSGAAALLLDKRPGLTPDQVKAILMKTARKEFPSSSTVFDPATQQTFVSFYDIFTVGAGYLDVWAALNVSDTPKAQALSPTAVWDPATNKVHLAGTSPDGSSAAWGNSAAWGYSAAWGNSGPYSLSAVWGLNFFVSGSSAAWGNSAVWGNSAAWGLQSTAGFSAVWGNSAAWGYSAPQGNSAAWGYSAAWGNSAAWGLNTMMAGEK